MGDCHCQSILFNQSIGAIKSRHVKWHPVSWESHHDPTRHPPLRQTRSPPPRLWAGLVIAAVAMLWVVGHELIPASHKPGREAAATAGLASGFAVMTLLAAVF